MKLGQNQLKQIIKEELKRFLNEEDGQITAQEILGALGNSAGFKFNVLGGGGFSLARIEGTGKNGERVVISLHGEGRNPAGVQMYRLSGVLRDGQGTVVKNLYDFTNNQAEYPKAEVLNKLSQFDQQVV